MTGTLPVRHSYSAETSPRGFLYHALRLGDLLRTVSSHRVLMRHFVGRELMGRFHGSMLGFGWVLVHPMFLFAVYFVVFGVVMGRWGPDQTWRESMHFALYLFTGLFCFHTISNGSMSALNSIVGSASLVKKVAFPAELLPMVPVLVETVVFLVGLIVAIVIGIATQVIEPGWDFLFLPWFLLILVGFTTGLGLLLANLNVFMRDVRQVYQVFVTAWFFVSPNFWSPDYFAGRGEWLQTLPKFNPVYHLLIAERQVLGFRDASLGISGSAASNLGIATVWAFGFLVVGYGTFMTHKHKYADLV